MPVRRAAVAVLASLLTLAVAGCISSRQAATTEPPSPAASSTGSRTMTGAAAQASAQLGGQIFATGKGGDGATIGTTSGAGGACARCHGNDAKGKIGPDIRWSVLTGAASSSHAPRFALADATQFEQAVTTGDAAGNQLRPMMPHYQLTRDQVAALAAYLQTL